MFLMPSPEWSLSLGFWYQKIYRNPSLHLLRGEWHGYSYSAAMLVLVCRNLRVTKKLGYIHKRYSINFSHCLCFIVRHGAITNENDGTRRITAFNTIIHIEMVLNGAVR